jgi:alpha-mannosidase
VERATHTNTSWDEARFEVPAQRWASVEEPGFGLALLNDCKYGYDVRANVIRLSLLRGPGWPDPEADAGTHRFSYALFPYAGGTAVEEVVAEAEAFNLPLRVVVAASPADAASVSPSSVVSLEGAFVSAVKRADDAPADLVVRCYEAVGCHRRAILEVEGARAASLTDALERTLEDLPIEEGRVILSLRPFEIATVRLSY